MHDIMERAKREAKTLAAKDPISCEELKVLGEWVDIIKDSKQCTYYDVESMKACLEAEYMKSIKFPNKMLEMELNERMLQEMDEPDYGMGRMGYDRWRYANGRFAPKGRGHETRVRLRRGYTPDYHMYPGMEYEDMYDDFPGIPDEVYGDYRMGYSGGRGGNSGGSYGGNRGNSGSSGSSGDGRSSNGRYGYESRGRSSRRGEAYDKYDGYRRHYTETKDPESAKHMKESMNEYVDEVMDSFKDVWRDADASDRQTIKQAMTKLVQQMQ